MDCPDLSGLSFVCRAPDVWVLVPFPKLAFFFLCCDGRVCAAISAYGRLCVSLCSASAVLS